MAVRDDFTPGEKLKAADLNDTFASKLDSSFPSSWSLVAGGSVALDVAGGTAVTVSGLDDYDDLWVVTHRLDSGTVTSLFDLYLNGDTSKYDQAGIDARRYIAFSYEATTFADTSSLGILLGRSHNGAHQISSFTRIENARSDDWKFFQTTSGFFTLSTATNIEDSFNVNGVYRGGAVTSVSLVCQSVAGATFTGGTLWVYGR